MDSVSKLSSLHDQLSVETDRLLSWEVGTQVKVQHIEGRITQVEEVTDSQGQILTQLETENARYRAELGETAHKRRELDQRIGHTTMELAVLRARLHCVRQETVKVKEDTKVELRDRQVERLEELTLAVDKLRINHRKDKTCIKTKLEETKRESNYEAETFSLIQEDLTVRASGMKEEINTKKKNLVDMNSKLQDEVKTLNEYLDSEKELEQQVTEAENDLTVKSEDKRNLEKATEELNKEIIDVRSAFEQEYDELENIVTLKTAELDNVVTYTENLVKQENELKKEITEISAETEKISSSVAELFGKIEENNRNMMTMQSQIQKERSLKQDLEVIKCDLELSEKDRKMAESEVMALASVEDMKAEIDQSNDILTKQIERLKKTRESKMEIQSSLNMDLEETENKLRLLEKEKSNKFEINKKQEREIEELRVSLADVENKVDVISKESEDLSNASLKLFEDIEENKSKLEKISSDAAVNKEELVKLERKNYEVQQETSVVMKEKVNLEECISFLENKSDEAENILKVLQQNDADMDIKMNERKSMLLELLKEEEQLKKQVEVFNEKFYDMESLETQTESCSEKKRMIKCMSDVVENLNNELVQIKNNVAATNNKISDLPKDDVNGDVDITLTNLMEQINESKSNNVRNINETESLEKELEKMEAEMKRQKISNAEKSALRKDTIGKLKDIKESAKSSKKKLESKLNELEQFKIKLSQVIEEVAKLSENKDEIKLEDLERERKAVSENFTRDLNELAESHAEKSKEVGRKKNDLQEKIKIIKKKIELEDIEIRTIKASKVTGATKRSSDGEKKISRDKTIKVSKSSVKVLPVSSSSDLSNNGDGATAVLPFQSDESCSSKNPPTSAPVTPSSRVSLTPTSAHRLGPVPATPLSSSTRKLAPPSVRETKSRFLLRNKTGEKNEVKEFPLKMEFTDSNSS